ncbi:MAG: agmatine/peptidylarginine deiminase [bacterium]
MAWPCARWESFGLLEQAFVNYAAVANAIAAFEPVTMFAAPAFSGEARARCSEEIEVVEVDLDDAWLRDSGPIFVDGDDGCRLGVDFRFNAWGEKFPTWEADDRVAAEICDRLAIESRRSPIVLEGGSITVDGLGTLITTEQCLLHPKRNPELDRHGIEAALGDWLGVTEVVWLGNGLVEDRDTDGHVDNLCAFVEPGKVICQTAPGADDPNHPLLSENLRRLADATDARGNPIEAIELPFLPRVEHEGRPVAIPYTNFYLVNGGVIVPIPDGGDPSEADALAVIAGAFPDREVVGVPSTTLALGGGGIHCITQQVPVVRGQADSG